MLRNVHGAAIVFCFFVTALCFSDDDPWQSPLEITDVRNDAITVLWHMPAETANRSTWQRAMISVIRSSVPLTKTSVSVNLTADTRTFKFASLNGNTTYRTSIEAFEGDVSLWYASNMATTSLASLHWLGAPTDLSSFSKTDSSLEISWNTPEILDTTLNAVITQHLVNVYEFWPQKRSSFKKHSFNVPVPKTSIILDRLSPGTVYNVTIQAGTSYGYGNLAWTAFSTLSSPDEEYVLRQKSKTPNSILLTWKQKWLPAPNAKFIIWAKTLHSADNVDKEITMNGQGEPGKPQEFLLRNLHPGSTYNVSITTTVLNDKTKSLKTPGKFAAPVTRKTAWSVFSTLTQGEYVVGQPRIVVETDTAASIVFQPLKQLGPVAYQIRYIGNDGSKPIETAAYSEMELRCPQFACDWMCALVFNLNRRTRDYSFEIRAKVDDIWNKWTPIARRPWNLLERVCSINPPTNFVENIGNEKYQRLVDVSYSQPPPSEEPWRYLVVIDSRQSDYSAIDISKLTDRATADIDRIPYYVTGSLDAEELKRHPEFTVGDGTVRGGYLNYPLHDNDEPHWTLVPVSQSENEIMDPRLKTCGFTQEGSFECDMSFWELTTHVPLWLSTTVVLLSIFCGIVFCVIATCWIRSVCGKSNTRPKESSVLYYHSDSPNTMSTTKQYRRVEEREFHPHELEERMRFLGE